MEYSKMLETRHAAVVGGSFGIGRAVSLLFALHGAKVAIIDDDTHASGQTLTDVKSHSTDSISVIGDLNDIESLFERALDKLGYIDILVNAGGIYQTGPLCLSDPNDFNTMLQSNILRTIRAVKAVVPGMKKHRRGDIITITSDLAVASLADTSAIAACAGAIYAFTRSVTLDYIRYHIRANCILCPLDALPGRKPLMGSPDFSDIANAALWYACDLSRNIIGEPLLVNGGMRYFTEQTAN